MRKITVENKSHIKELLYDGCILGLKGDSFSSFGGFERWWYDKAQDRCISCCSFWSGGKRRLKKHSLDKAAKILWRNHKSLFVYTQNIPDGKLEEIKRHFEK